MVVAANLLGHLEYNRGSVVDSNSLEYIGSDEGPENIMVPCRSREYVVDHGPTSCHFKGVEV